MDDNREVVKEKKFDAKVISESPTAEGVDIDIQVATARRYRRDLPSALKNILFIATQDKETAEKCFYTVVRDGKKIRGASIRLAEIIANCYGNLRISSRVIGNNGKVVTAQGACWDLESNVAYSIEVERRITDKFGNTYSDDMQVTTSNACISIALRNAIFKCIPLALTNKIQEDIMKVVKGQEKDLVSLREHAVNYFTEKGVSLKNILSVLQRDSINDLTQDDVVDLRGIATAILDGDTTLEQAFSLRSSLSGKGVSALGSKLHKMIIEPVEIIEESKEPKYNTNNIKLPSEEKAEKKQDNLVAPIEKVVDGDNLGGGVVSGKREQANKAVYKETKKPVFNKTNSFEVEEVSQFNKVEPIEHPVKDIKDAVVDTKDVDVKSISKKKVGKKKVDEPDLSDTVVKKGQVSDYKNTLTDDILDAYQGKVVDYARWSFLEGQINNRFDIYQKGNEGEVAISVRRKVMDDFKTTIENGRLISFTVVFPPASERADSVGAKSSGSAYGGGGNTLF